MKMIQASSEATGWLYTATYSDENCASYMVESQGWATGVCYPLVQHMSGYYLITYTLWGCDEEYGYYVVFADSACTQVVSRSVLGLQHCTSETSGYALQYQCASTPDLPLLGAYTVEMLYDDCDTNSPAQYNAYLWNYCIEDQSTSTSVMYFSNYLRSYNNLGCTGTGSRTTLTDQCIDLTDSGSYQQSQEWHQYVFSNDDDDDDGGSSSSLSTTNKVIIGVVVSVGGLLIIGAGVWIFIYYCTATVSPAFIPTPPAISMVSVMDKLTYEPTNVVVVIVDHELGNV